MIPEFVKEIDLIALVRSDLGRGMQTGKWVKWFCPFCARNRNNMPSFLFATNGNETSGGRWICKCCNAQGDAIAWLQKRRRMSNQAAIDYLRNISVNAKQSQD